MAKPPKTRSISLEEFEDLPAEVKPAFEKLIGLLNGFLTDSGNAFDQLLGENRTAQFEENVKILTDGSGNLSGVKFKNRLPGRPRAVSTVNLRPVSASVALDYPVCNPIWILTSKNEIQIDHLDGLSNSTEYKATFKVE